MDWTFNVPIKFYEYTVNEMKLRLNELEIKDNVVFIASKRLIQANNLLEVLDCFEENFILFDESLTSLHSFNL